MADTDSAGDGLMEIVRTWPPSAFLGSLTAKSATDLISISVQRLYSPGSVLLREGERSSYVVLLLEGLASVVAVNPAGQNVLMAIRGPGDVLGEVAAISGSNEAASAIARTNLVAAVVPGAEFRAFLESDPSAAIGLTETLAKRLRTADKQRLEFEHLSVTARLARVLSELAQTYGVARDEGILLDVSLSQPELASLVGAAEPTVQKALRELRRLELVTTGYRRITVRDLVGLTKLSHYVG